MKKRCSKTKKLISAILAMCLICASAALAGDAEERERLAKEYIPEEVNFKSKDVEYRYVELEYLSLDGEREYSLALDFAGAIILLSFEDESVIDHTGAALDEGNILAAFALAFPEAEPVSLALDKDGDEYVIVFRNATDVFGICELCAADGELEGYKLYYALSPDAMGSALAALEAEHPGAALISFKPGESDNVYEGKALLDGGEYEFRIDVGSMKLYEWELDD